MNKVMHKVIRSKDVVVHTWQKLRRTRPCAVTLGNFDGVHTGHKAIIQTLINHGKKLGLEPVVLTFHPHPKSLLQKSPEVDLLSTLVEKKVLFMHAGAVTVYFINFDLEFSKLSHLEFLQSFLVGQLKAQSFILGENHRFGNNARGNAEWLKKTLHNGESCVKTVHPVKIDNTEVNSSVIRKALKAGEIKWANQMLGYPYFYSGRVVKGDGRGRKLGFPTVNLEPENAAKLLVFPGVYGARAVVGDREFNALVNIGNNPTFQVRKTKIEAYILDFDEDIYGQKMAIELNSYVREEKEFESSKQLVYQIEKDIHQFKNQLER